MDSVVLKTERRNPVKSPDEPFTYVDISSIDSKIGAIVNPKELQGREAPSRARKVIRSGDVIFAITRPYLRNIALVPDRYDDQICSTGFCVLRANRELLDPLWLYHLCRSDVVLDQVLPRMRGASYPAVTDSDVLASEIPLPPLNEQRRIVARIEELFARIEEAQRLRAAADQDTERLMPAALAEVFPHPVDRLSELWPVSQLGDGDLCTVIPGQHILSSDYSNEEVGVPYLTGPADFGSKFPQISKWTRSPKVFCQPGDVLLTVKGAGVGKVNCAPQFEASIGRQIMALRPNPEWLSMDFLFYFLASRFADFQAMGQSATVPGIRKDHVEQFGIPLTPLSEQRRIVEYLDGVQAQVAELKRLQAESAAELERLSGAVLARAFRGEL